MGKLKKMIFAIMNESFNLNTVAFRKFEKGDLRFLREMLLEAIFIHPGSPPLDSSILEEASISKYLDNWDADRGDFAVLACVNSNPVGAIWARLFTKENPGYGFVSEDVPEISMAVNKLYRSLGIGSKLLYKLEREFRARKVTALSLSVDVSNPAKRLYERHGFHDHRLEGSSVTMVKSLDL